MDRRQLIPLFIWVLLLLLAFVWLTTTVPIRSDLSLFLPAGSGPVERVMQYKLREGVASRLILIGIEGGSLEQRAEASRQLRRELLKLEQFNRVENGTVESLQPDPLLFEYRYLLSQEREAVLFTVQGLQRALDRRIQELTAPYPSPFKQYLPRDPTAAYPELLKQWLPAARPMSLQGVWFSTDRQRALLIAETRAKGMEMDSQQQALDAIRQQLGNINSSGQLQLSITGPGVFAVHSREVIRGESMTLSVVSSVAIALILLLAYRSWRIMALAALPLITAMLAGSCMTGLLFGELHGITLAFGITLLGVTIDYPIHLFSHLKAAEQPSQSLKRIWGTLRMGVVTTCIGYLVMAASDFRGLSQLGVFTIGGLLAGALTTRVLLPGLIRKGWHLGMGKGAGQIPRPGRLPAALMLAAGLCSLLYLSLQPTTIWQDDLSSMSVLPEQLLDLDREMRAQLNAPEVSHLIILHDLDIEAALQRMERLESGLDTLVESKAIAGFDLAIHYLPSRKSQLQRRAALPSDAQLSSNLEQALASHRFRAGLFSPFLQDVAATRNLQPLKLEQLSGTAVGRQLANLINRESDEWFLLVPLYGVTNPSAIRQLVTQGNNPSIRYLQLGEDSRQMVIGFRDGILSKIGWGMLAMICLLLIGLKSIRSALLVLLPVLVAISLTISLLLLLGEKLSIFHLVALMLVVGIGIDYSLFFGRQEESEEDDRRTFHALAVCATSTCTVFTILASSEIPVLSAIGLTTAIGIVGCFIASLLFAGIQHRTAGFNGSSSGRGEGESNIG